MLRENLESDVLEFESRVHNYCHKDFFTFLSLCFLLDKLEMTVFQSIDMSWGLVIIDLKQAQNLFT